MTTRIASIISFVLHPLMMSTYLFLLLIFNAPHAIVPIGFSSSGSIVLVALIFITTFVIPVLSLFILKMSGSISSLLLEKREERITPMLYTIIMYAVTTYMFSTKIELGELIFVFLAITTMLIVVTVVITIFWKISLHGIGIGGLIGLMIGVNQHTVINYFEIILPLLFLAAALVLSARLKLNAHSPHQVYSGFVLGISISCVSFIIYLI